MMDLAYDEVIKVHGTQNKQLQFHPRFSFI